MKENVLCRYNKYGHCKYNDSCHFRHVNVICVTKECGVFDCDKRHPVVCNYFKNFKRCKFSPCSYNHRNIDVAEDTDDKIKNLESKLMEIVNTEKKKNTEKKMEAFEKVYEIKIEKLEINLKKLNNIIEEKDDKIKNLESKFDELETKLGNFTKNDEEIHKKLQDFEKLFNTQQKNNKESFERLDKLEANVEVIEKVNKCPKCEFSTSSETGLKTHIKRIHEKTAKNKEIKSYPTKCNLCEKNLKSKAEM